MNVLIVDDDNTKIAQIVSIIKNEFGDSHFKVDTALDSFSAQSKIRAQKYELLIIDLFLPLRSDSEPDKFGGKLLAEEIERRKDLKSPNYIIAITQHENHEGLFPDIWVTLHYNNSVNWKHRLVRVIRHIKKSSEKGVRSYIEKPTIIVEGITDTKYLFEALNIFEPSINDYITIKSDKNAGAKWVSNQIVAWAHSRNEGSKQKIKAIGLLDGDKPGLEAKEEINRIIPDRSSMRNLFKIINLSGDYARDLIPIFAKGILVPVSIEELLPPFVWHEAEKMGWLEERNLVDFSLENKTAWNPKIQSLDDFIKTLELSDNEDIYLKKVQKHSKNYLCNYVIGLDDITKKKALKNFEKLIYDIKKYLV